MTQTEILYAIGGKSMLWLTRAIMHNEQRRTVMEQSYQCGQMQPKVTSVGEVKRIVDGLCGNVKSEPKRDYSGNGGKMPEKPQVKEKD